MATASAISQRVAAVVYNPIKVSEGTLRAAITRAERKAGWAPTLWFETTEEDPGGGQTRQAIEQGATMVMAAGGDGTVRAVAEALYETDVSLALLPSGTGNLLARNLDLTLDHLEESIETAFEGADRSIDLGVVEAQRVDGTRERNVFLVMAGVGLDAQMIANTNPELKKKVGWLAYVDAAGRVITSLDKVRVHVRLDGGRTTRSTVNTMLIGNCGTVTNGIILLPDAAIDDGMLDIALIRPRGLRGWMQVAGYIARNNMLVTKLLRRRGHLGHQRTGAALGYGQAKETQARLEEPRAVQVDGDVVGEAVALRATIREDALKVRVPKEHARDAGPAV
jgi:diacylglycerol kinase (ATP)